MKSSNIHYCFNVLIAKDRDGGSGMPLIQQPVPSLLDFNATSLANKVLASLKEHGITDDTFWLGFYVRCFGKDVVSLLQHPAPVYTKDLKDVLVSCYEKFIDDLDEAYWLYRRVYEVQ